MPLAAAPDFTEGECTTLGARSLLVAGVLGSGKYGSVSWRALVSLCLSALAFTVLQLLAFPWSSALGIWIKIDRNWRAFFEVFRTCQNVWKKPYVCVRMFTIVVDNKKGKMKMKGQAKLV